ncbi:LysR family transcriptional regulator [Candidatus Thalassolituus haligoni]|jgi:DNA-binding transcriptional LysR family regulator|uniref:LysR family transcriptional regulator n=1 Tax=Candidatus Thalassolituus haligoni TaxID=3100113 RepID=UPI003514B76D|tara:strand:+ start:7044 stop:7967 length:924 start_codon:yes stop_codon:yes gene_type:complete
MRFNKLDLNLLIALDVLLKERSITRAAEKLNLSPSAVSNSLSRLREYFNDDILTQIGRKMYITPLGEDMQDSVRNVLNLIESSILIQPNFDPATTDRTFSIFCSDYTQMVLIPHLLMLAEQQNSNARFRFLPQIENPHKSMERGEADLLIIPSDFVSAENPSDVLYEEDFVCMMWNDSAIAHTPLTVAAYANAGHVSMEPSAHRRDFFSQFINQEYGINRHITVSTYSFAVLPSMVVGTENIATVHARLARQIARIWPLTIKPVPFAMARMKQCVQWHQYRNNDKGLIWLRELLVKATSQLDISPPA